MTATTARFTMLAVRLADGRYLSRRGKRIVVSGPDYNEATHYQHSEYTGGETACRILRRDAILAGIEGASTATIVAVDNDDLATLRVWQQF